MHISSTTRFTLFLFAAIGLSPLATVATPFAAPTATIDPVATGSVQGYVVDAAGRPAAGLQVRLQGTVRRLTTDDRGFFQFRSLPEGTYVVEASGVGVQVQTQLVSVRRDETTTLNLTVQEAVQHLAAVNIVAAKGLRERKTLPDVGQSAIYAGKKTEVIDLAALDANLVTNNSRQVFSKTPGVMVWENDGSGMQVGVSVRGLSPNRSWEFNVRQNGVDISSDPFGYPEAYYNPPMEAVARIELVRGGGSLQYGPQFGGLLNYVLKPAADKPFSVETQQSVGSYGLVSTYNRVSGTVGKLQYNAYAHYRHADGWRDNSRYGIFNGYAALSYAVTNRLKLGLDVSRMYNESQQAGGLTDGQFAQDARQSSRTRNWFSTPWTVPTLTAEYAFTDKTRLTATLHGLLGERNSIGFTSAITTPDNLTAARQIDQDSYRNWGSELRLLTRYRWLGQEQTLATGLKQFNGYTHRQQQGRGDTGSNFNLNGQTSAFPRDLSLGVVNVAAFVEHLFRLSPRLTVTPGLRLESLSNDIAGRLSLNANGTENGVSQQSTRRFMLAGVGTEYKFSETITFYGNASQAYRPVLFSDLTPAAVTDFVVDPNLRDARGHTLDVGVRGRVQNYLNFDVSYFYLNYNDRIGTLTLLNEAGWPDVARPYQFRTNIGQSVSQGVEAYVEFDPVAALVGHSRVGHVSLFGSVGYTDARYRNLRVATVSNGQVSETNLRDRFVENAPTFIGRFGLNYTLKTVTFTALMNRVGRAYSDANNTETPTANAQTGVIPAYRVFDLSASLTLAKRYTLRTGINNLTDERYFTRRAGGYPGPGILPADGRTGYLSVGLRL